MSYAMLSRKNSAGTFANASSRARSSQAHPLDQSRTHPAPSIVTEVLHSPGWPLDSAPREFLEPRLHFDLSRVRIHNDEKAAQSASAIGSLAYAAGDHIVFGRHQYNPHTAAGLGLLTHELGHVAQQSGAAPPEEGKLTVGEPESQAEKNADRISESAAARHNPPHIQSHPTQVMRATRTYALTFDDGPHTAELGKGTNRTEKVLDTLKSKGVKAGFFIQTSVSFRGANPVGRALVARMQKEGHGVGIHTGGAASHKLHTESQKAGRLQGELESAKKYVKEQTGQVPTLVRPPKGRSDADVIKTYAKVGLTKLGWDWDGDLGKSLSLGDLKARVETGITKLDADKWKPSTASKPRFVFLYHDIQQGTADNLEAIIDHIKATTGTVTKKADTAAFAAP
jgi:peptidoglycan/xylan/chitin deacetylase (PgdA/CDA1 family)